MFGQDGVHPGSYGPGEKLIVRDLEGIAVDNAQILDAQKILGIGAARSRVRRQLAGKGHVRGGQFLAVLPEDALAQGKTQTLAAVLQAPALGGPGFRLQIFVVAQGRHVEQVGNFMRRRIGRKIRDEVGSLPNGAEQNAPAVHRRGGGFPMRGGNCGRRAPQSCGADQGHQGHVQRGQRLD